MNADKNKSLTNRVINGGKWIIILQVVSRIFQFLRIIFLVRMLSPNDFGLFGIALLTLSTIESITQTGLEQSLIQKQKNINIYLDVAWTAQILRGIAIALILYFSSPFISIFFQEPQVKNLLQVLAFAVLINEFRNIGVIYFIKDIEFKKQIFYELPGLLVDIVVSIILSIILKSALALVYGLLAGNIIRLIMSYVIHNYRPSLKFDLKKTKDLFSYGRWILFSSVLIFLLTQGDDIFVGKILGATALGFYQIAF
ncbi:oligosaccharide flippase family protein, partial [Pelotomaculum propionicicum]|uniref:oligosaccharide flippase family protein n=1 Tax=Pelotomaculum propionicicum TaxID=258475 RepID=UPI003B76A33B